MNQVLKNADFTVNPTNGWLTVSMVVECPHNCDGTVRFPDIYMGHFKEDGTYKGERQPILYKGMYSSSSTPITSVYACGICTKCGTLMGITADLTRQLADMTANFVRKTLEARAHAPA